MKISRRQALVTLAAGAAALTKAPTLWANTASPVAGNAITTAPKVTYLGGPTYLIEVGGFRIISDPGFDPQGSERDEGPGHLLTKVMEPPIPVDEIGKLDAALVSHAQHFDNLDNAGRELLKSVPNTFVSPDSAVLLSETKGVVGLASWESNTITNSSGESLRITAVPAVHTSNPDLLAVIGEVTGFVLEWNGQKNGVFYISGDTVYIPEMKEIANRYKIAAAILHMGRANVPAVGDNFLTMDGEQGAQATIDMNIPKVYPAHFEGWRHFPEGAWFIERDFEAAGVRDRIDMLRPGQTVEAPF